ncbi:hypothetical protein GCM10027174_33380 [Salinifilum aidingensis]
MIAGRAADPRSTTLLLSFAEMTEGRWRFNEERREKLQSDGSATESAADFSKGLAAQLKNPLAKLGDAIESTWTAFLLAPGACVIAVVAATVETAGVQVS